jgi:hypothetical protein
MCPDDQDSGVGVSPDQHAPVEVRWRVEIATGQRTSKLVLDDVLPLLARAAAELPQRRHVRGPKALTPEVGGVHSTSGMPDGIRTVGTPVTFRTAASVPRSTPPHGVP